MKAKQERGQNKAKGNDALTNRQAGEARVKARSTRLRGECRGDGEGIVQLAAVPWSFAEGYQRAAVAERPTFLVTELCQLLGQLHGGLRP